MGKTLHGFVMREAAVCGQMKPRHLWHEEFGHKFCKVCGVVRKSDGSNDDAPCKGPAGIALRTQTEKER